MAESSEFSIWQFANWDQVFGFYAALYDTYRFYLAPATQELPDQLLAMATRIGSKNAPIFVASTCNSLIFVASTTDSPISVSSTVLTPIAAPQVGPGGKFALKVPKGAVPIRAQSVGTPTPTSHTLQPFLMLPPSSNFGKATPSPGPPFYVLQSQVKGELPVTPATSLTLSGAILISDSDDEDHVHEKGKKKQPGMRPIPHIGNVIVIGDSNDDSSLSQKPYLSSPSHSLTSSPPMPTERCGMNLIEETTNTKHTH